MSERTYLDWNATAPLRPQARAAMAAAMDGGGEPVVRPCRGSRRPRISLKRRGSSVAAAVGAEPRNVIFTSGGSEANALALSRAIEHGGWALRCGDRLGHRACLGAGGRRFPVGRERSALNRDGVASIGDLQARLTRGGRQRRQVATGGADGGQQRDRRDPAGARSRRPGACRGRPAACRCGAGAWQDIPGYQGIGSRSSGGVGAQDRRSHGRRRPGSWQRQAACPRLPFRRRPGAQPARRHRESSSALPDSAPRWRKPCATSTGEARRLSSLRQRLENGLRAIWPDTVIFGENVPSRVANTLQFAVPGIKAQTALMALDLDGIAVSSGSACSSGTMKFSEVVRGMGYELEIAEGAVRVSMGWTTVRGRNRPFSQSLEKAVAITT